MDGTELDEIMNEDLSSEVVEQPATEATKADGQPRDETGRFAPKAQEEAQTEDPDHAARTAVEAGEVNGKGGVPVAAVQAEREKARAERDRANDLQRQLAELRGQVSVLTQQRQQPEKPKEEAKPKSFWENPDDFVGQHLAPVQQAVQQQRFELSRLLADEKFGADVVEAADAELGKLMQAKDPSVAALQAQIANSRHPYAELVSWHQRRQAMAEIGDDPAAYRERLRAELLAELGQGDGPPPTPANPTPSSTKPLTQLPKSLSRLPGGGNSAGDEDNSDAGIFASAMGGR